MERAFKIDEKSYGSNHPNVATSLNGLATLLLATSRLKEAEPLLERALQIDEKSYGPDHPSVARDLNNLAQLLKATNRLKEAESMAFRAVKILVDISQATDHLHPNLQPLIDNYVDLLMALGWDKERVLDHLRQIGISFVY
jgi:tetratricopeptide (TPR) repeat protein